MRNKHGERSSATPNERPQVRAETYNFRRMNCYPILALGVTVVGCLLTSRAASPLPPEEKLKARLHALESKLKAIYTERLTTRKEGVADELREEQQAWLKARYEGANIYLAFAPKGEVEPRRLQFLADVTAARIEDLQPAWE